MTRQVFFEKFDLLIGTPDAAEKMQDLVLKLAVMGRLVEQDESEGSATELLEDLRAERGRLVADGRIKARRTGAIQNRERPYELPPAWTWARLFEVGYELGQKVPDQPFTYIDVGSIDSERGRISDRVEVLEPNDAPSRARKLVRNATVIYSTVRPYLRNIAIVDRDFDPEPIASTAFAILHPFLGINSRYLFYWLRSAPFTNYVEEGMKGVAYPAINDEKFYNGLIPLPPVPEQNRIVEKVNHLMTLVDALETQLAASRTMRANLVDAMVAELTKIV